MNYVNFMSMKVYLIIILFLTFTLSIGATEQIKEPNQVRKSNALIHEKSPYLLQHAYNPVNWYAWNEESLNLAKKENKPIFLSIGYSTCHWCHVMEKECFEDSEVSKLMNEAFINIKVDREERPDIDQIYMTVSQIMTGSGGWPLNVILTPDKKPFFAGSYIPKKNRFGRIGMMELIPKITQLWNFERDKVLKSAEQISTALIKNNIHDDSIEIDPSVLEQAFQIQQGKFDSQYGGFGNAPKFPTPHQLLFLLRYWKRSNNDQALKMVEKTMTHLYRGGIFDHVGFGFHRYSTDRQWLVPHFEKMLYDQAMLTLAYTECYQITKNEKYKETAQKVLNYVLRDMKSSQGGFFSGEDADSEGVEGKFYVWESSEIDQILGDDSEFFKSIFNVSDDGNYLEEATREKTGDNILHLNKDFESLAKEQKISVSELKEKIENLRVKMFDIRERRVHPFKDDKVLTDWNGLMIAACAKAYRVLGDEKYLQAASSAIEFILKNLISNEDKLLHRYRDNESGIKAYLDDYAFFIWGLIETYESTFKVSYLEKAISLIKIMINDYWDEENGGFFFTADDGEKLLIRQKELYDGALPSGNAVALSDLIRLGRMTGDPFYENYASTMIKTFSKKVSSYPDAYLHFLNGIIFSIGPSYEIVISGQRDDPKTTQMIQIIREKFLPNSVVVFKDITDDESDIAKIAPYTELQKGVDGQAAVYICQNGACQRPITDIKELINTLH